MFVSPRSIARSLLFTSLAACSGPALPETHHAVIETPGPAAEAPSETPARAVLVCPPEPEEEAEEDGLAEPVDEESAESSFDVEDVVQRALGEHARCAPHLFAGSSFLQDYGSAGIAPNAHGIEVYAGSSGGGVYGGSDVFFALVDPTRCRPLITVETGWNDRALMSPARVGIAPAQAVVGLLAESTFLRAYTHDAPEAALFQLLMRQRPHSEVQAHVAQTFALRGPLYARRPAFHGEPHPSAVGYLVPTRGMPAAMLRNLRARLAADSEEYEEFEEDEANRPRALPGFVRVMAVESAMEDYASGSFIVRSFRMLGRNEGALVALIDTTSNTYRWVLETRSAVLGSSVEWRGAHRGFLAGEYHSDHPGGPYGGAGGIVVLRLTDGAIFELHVPGIFEQGAWLLATELEDATSAHFDACVEATTRAFAASSGYPISELEDTPWWCRENEVLVRWRAELERSCASPNALQGLRVDAGQLWLRTLEGERLVSLDEIIDAAQ